MNILLIICAILVLTAIDCKKKDSCGQPRECQVVKKTKNDQNKSKIIANSLLCKSDQLSAIDFSKVTLGSECEFDWQSAKELSFQPKKGLFKTPLNASLFHLLQAHEISINFHFVKYTGFILESETISSLEWQPEVILSLNFYESRMDFYWSAKRPVKSCQDLIAKNFTRPFTIFQMKPNLVVRIHDSEFRQKLCPLLFQKAKINTFIIVYMIDSFYRTSVLRFESSNTTETETLDSNVDSFILDGLMNVHVDENLLNFQVFRLVRHIFLRGFPRSIQVDLFKPFQALRGIVINDWKRLVHRQGIEWVTSVNWNLRVNLSDSESIRESLEWLFSIVVEFSHVTDEQSIIGLLPEEDFCAYKEFPFEQMVLFSVGADLGFDFDPSSIFNGQYSCTYLWLVHSYEVLSEFEAFLNQSFPQEVSMALSLIDKIVFERCNFSRLVSNCDKRKFLIPSRGVETSWVDVKIHVVFVDFVIAILTLVMCPVGFVTNLLVVLVVSNKKNQKDLDEQRYFHYMRINAIANCSIFLIHLLGLMNECKSGLESFCSSIHQLVPIQLYKIIFTEFLGTGLRFLSALSYIAFTLSRISLLGKEHGKLVNWLATVKMKTFLGWAIFISLALSVVKIFEYQLNFSNVSMPYPIKFQERIEFLFKSALIEVFLIFNLISDVGNYIVLIVLQLVADICLAVQLKRTLAAKMQSSMNEKQKQIKKKQNESAVKRAVVMVILNASFNFLLKMPNSLRSILDLKSFFDETVIRPMFFSSSGGFFKFCAMMTFCELFDFFSKLTFFISLAFNLVFFYVFDKNFKISFLRVFGSKKVSEGIQSILRPTN